METVELIGRRFGRLVLVECVGKNESNRRVFRAKCDCGKEATKDILTIRRAVEASCGCSKAEKARVSATKHGGSEYIKGVGRSPTYQTWVGMRFRCRDKTDLDYGGRGISVCERWDSYALFLADMGERPKDHEIDRIDGDGNYEPSNCRWLPHADNSRNRRRVRLTMEKAEAIRQSRHKTAAQLAAEYGVSIPLINKIRGNKVWAK